MASEVITNGFISVGGTDLSSHARRITVDFTADEQEDTAMGDSWRSRKMGLKDVSVSVDWNQDFAASQLDATLWPLFGTDDVAVIVRKDAGSVAATNPQYSGNIGMSQYTPVNGDVGSVHQFSTTWPGTGTWTRATS